MDSSNPAPTDTITSTTPGGAADQMMPITITHLVLIAVLIALTILMIWWGNKRWRQRRAGERELDDRGSTVEVGGDARVADTGAADTGTRDAGLAHVVQPAAEPPVPVGPVAPPPPPLADDVVPATPAGQAAAPAAGDLTLLKGLGPRAAALLGERGVATIENLAALSAEQAAALDADLGPFAGRMARDRWHEQARLLAAGDRARYEAVFGKIG